MTRNGSPVDDARSGAGLIAVFGSGETSPAGRKAHDYIMARLPKPVAMAILETPAGFQPNVDWVAEKIAAFVRHGLQNYDPQPIVVRARKRGTEFDPDFPEIADELLAASYIFLGPGSPTYAVRQLRGTLTLQRLLERNRQGAAVGVASAGALAAGRWVLPVYEIYKSGEELRWEPGLDLFAPLGLDVTVVTHWNNKDGGRDLDTSRCYMGLERWDRLMAMVPPETVILGVDEMVTCILDPSADECRVMGPGSVTVINRGETRVFKAGERFSVDELRPLSAPVGVAGAAG